MSTYGAKGKSVFIEGRLQTRKWADREGNDRYTTEIVASDMHMLGGRGPGGGSSSAGASSGASSGGEMASHAGVADTPMPDFDDDIPF